MTLYEVSEILELSENTIKNQFKRAVKKASERGLILSKEGRGEFTEYIMEEDENFNDGRAMTIFEEKNDIYLEDDMIKMVDWNLLVFVGVCLTPMLTFRGSYEDFLKYSGIVPSASNIELLKTTLEEMNDIYIGYYPDKTDENYFTASLYRKVEKEMKVSIIKLKKCKEIQEKYHSRSFIPILKTWLATEKAIEHQPYTIQDLADLTGLPQSTLKRTTKQLKESDIYISKKNYIPQLNISRGVTSELNGFYSK